MRILFLFFCSMIFSCSNEQSRRDIITSLSISSSGQYIVTVDSGKQLVLWSLKNYSYKIISQGVNRYSAAFLQGSEQFIWQDCHRYLHRMDVSGKQFHPIHLAKESYGHIGTNNLQDYIYVTDLWELIKLKDNKEEKIKYGSLGIEFFGKLLDLSMDVNGHYLLTSGDTFYKGNDLPLSKGLTFKQVYPQIPNRLNHSLLNGVVLWDLNTGKPLRKFIGNQVKTHAVISPDGRYIVAGDENSLAFVWEAKTGKRLFELDSLYLGKRLALCADKTYCHWDSFGLIRPPQNFCEEIADYDCLKKENVNAIRFISQTQYFRFTEGVPYAVLYDVLSPKPQKYFRLAGKPFVYGYVASATIATIPGKGLLAMAKSRDNGLDVYKFNEKKRTLDRIWSASIDWTQRT